MGRSSHRAALLLVGILGGTACADGGQGMVANPGLGYSGTGGVSGFPTAGTAATAGTMAVPTAGTMAAPIAGTGAAGTGIAGTGAAGTGTAGTGTAGTGTAGTGAAGTGAAGMGEAGTGTAGTGDTEPSCLDGITGFAAEGPFEYQAMPSGSIKMWIPMVPAGCKVPVIHLANGTGGTCGAYQMVLNRLASHGFLTTCYESGSTGAGTQGVMAIEKAFELFPDLADTKIGSMGHSQGGQAAFTVLQQAEAKWGDSYTYTGLAMQPASGFGEQPSIPWATMYGMIKSPMFMFSGTSDSLVSEAWVQRGFDALADSIEAYNWSAIGATHVPTPQAATMDVQIAWFRWKLLGDQAACTAFKALPGGGKWESMDEQNPQSCM